jgi:flagellar hook-basal body complex protein FliE
MAIDPLSASKAYLSTAKAIQGAVREADGAGDTPIDFGAMVKTAMASAEQAAKGAEQAGLAAAAGRADIVDVATAVAAAETTLETVLAVRDQVISAYQEILRMPI